MTSEVTLNLKAAGTRGYSKSIAPHIPTVVRGLLGLLFLVSGLNGLLNFLPPPSVQLPQGATAFVGALLNTGYMLQLIAITQLVVGALLVSNRFVPLALTLLAPFVVNSIAFHIFLEPSGRGMALLVLAMQSVPGLEVPRVVQRSACGTSSSSR